MSNTVNVNIAASDNGSIGKVTNEAKKLNKELAAAQKAAASIRPASQTAAVSGANDMTDVGANRLAKGISGVTGAAGRDFAKQAQGLGGLVHVYATFAANLFAVSAAFTALSKAADYTNMVKGLDQLGAASGKNLGTMAQNMVKLTDGAISLKESMTAVAQASSAGMSGTQIERMALVAKKASQALGRDMTDSVNRLSRGITKMEPELLDEIGIFVRVDKAAQDYALSVGKTANSLTDFEKRQAFANAALKQAEDKFGKIELDSNPYSKLLASFTNLAYAGGELINKVLSPIANLLSQSPTALSAVMLGITAMLVKQAIPALTTYRENIKQAAIETAELAQKRVDSAKASQLRGLKDLKNSFEAEADLRQAELEQTATREAKAAAKVSAKKSKVSSWALDIANTENVRDITDSQLSKLDKYAAKNTAVAASYREIARAIRAAQEAEQKYDLANQALKEAQSKQAPYGSTMATNQRIAEEAQSKAARAKALDKFMETSQTAGMLSALKEIDDDINKARESGTKITKLESGITKFKAATIGAVTSVTHFISSIGRLLGYVGIAITVFEIFNSFFTTNAKQAEAFSSAVDQSKEAVEGLSRTVDLYTKQEYFSTASISAYANALEGLVSSAEKLIDTFSELKKSDNWLSKAKNWLSDVYNGDDERTLATNLSKTVVSSLKAADSPALSNSLKDLLGTNDLSFDNLEKILDKLANAKDTVKLDRIKEELKASSKEANIAASNLTAFNNAMTSADRALQQLSLSMLPGDQWSKFGIAQMDAANAFGKALENPKNLLAAMKELVEDTSRLKILPPENAQELLRLSEVIKSTNHELKIGTDGLEQYAIEIEKLKAGGNRAHFNNGKAVSAKAKGLEYGMQQSQEAVNRANKNIAEITSAATRAAAASYDSGSKKLSEALSTAIAQGAVAAQKTLVSGISGTGTAEIQADLDRRSISLQIEAIKVQRDLVLATTKTGLIYEQGNLRDKLKDTGLSTSDREMTKKSLDRVTDSINILEVAGKGGKLLKTMVDNASEGAKAELGGAVSTTMGAETALSAKYAEVQSVKYREKLTSIAEEYTQRDKILDQEKESISTQLKSIDLANSDKDIYNATLASSRESLITRQDEIDLQKKQNALLLEASKWEYIISNTKSEKDKKKLTATASENLGNLAKSFGATRESNEVSIRDRGLKDNEAQASAAKYRLSQVTKISEIEGEILGYYREAGVLTESQLINKKAQLDIDAVRSKYAIDINKLEADKLKDPSNAANYQKSIDKLKNEVLIETERLSIASRYKAKLVETEETLRSIEKTGGSVSDYVDNMYQDFSNKVSELVKTTKSAADTFNSGFINAIDSSIDKFFDMMQKSELNFKDLVKFARNALSDVFRDTASQMLKNAWKSLAKNFLPESDESKAARLAENQLTATQSLIQALDNNTRSKGGSTTAATAPKTISNPVGGFTNPIGPASAGINPKTGETDWEKQSALDEKWLDGTSDASDKTKEASGGFLASAKGMGQAVSDFFTGGATFNQAFGRVVEGFGNMMPSFLTNTYNVIAAAFGAMSAGSGGGGGLFGGLLGTALKAGLSYFTGGASTALGPDMAGSAAVDWGQQGMLDEMWLYSAKGNVLKGSAELSAYSNSIVTSPTTFAFAKGGVPSYKGMAGESGPEAIMPLKRDAQGNLGIRGGGEMVNNIDINITIEGGSESGGSDGGMSKDMAGLLGNSIKAAVTQELIKQSRPGGLLAR